MTTREFIQHLVLNCELDDPVKIEVCVNGRYLSFDPAHASQIGADEDDRTTLIECKPMKE